MEVRLMATRTRSFTRETAKQFDRYSIGNAVTLRQALSCGCEPYRDVFTYRRWQAQVTSPRFSYHPL